MNTSYRIPWGYGGDFGIFLRSFLAFFLTWKLTGKTCILNRYKLRYSDWRRGRAGWTPKSLAFPPPAKVSFWHLNTLRDVRRFECVIELLLVDHPKFPQQSAWAKADVWSTQHSDPFHHSIQKCVWGSALPLLNSVISSTSLSLGQLGFLSLEVSEGWPRAVDLYPGCTCVRSALQTSVPRPHPQGVQSAFIFGWSLNVNVLKHSPDDSNVWPQWSWFLNPLKC